MIINWFNTKMCIDILHSYTSLLDSIKVINIVKLNIYESVLLLDQIILSNVWFDYLSESSNFKFYYFDDEEWEEINPIFLPFKRVDLLQFENSEHARKQLKIIKKANLLEVEILNFNCLSPNEFDEILKSDYI